MSWRVLILPWIEQQKLFKEFKLDEPWDSKHNIQLLPRMPSSYELPGSKKDKVPPYHTILHVFVGKGAAFEWNRGRKVPEDFPDGVADTFLVVEAGKPVPWTKPEELVYAPDQPLPDLDCVFKDDFRAITAGGGSFRWIKNETSEATLRAAITRNGSDELGPDWQR